jgi:ferredoxin/flavodoxin---NADP+ reductase
LDPITIDSDLIIKSIGYQTSPLIGLPFDHKKKILPHEHGCIIDPENDNKPIPGVYVAGWAKRGPVGIIDATLRDTKQTFGVLKHHLESN